MKLKIDKQTLLWVVLIAPFLRPNGIGEINSFIGRIYYFAMIISCIVLALLYFRKRISDYAFILLLSIMMLWILLVTIFSDGDVIIFVRVIVMILGVSLCTEIFASKPKKFFVALLTNFEFVIYLNFIFLLCYPSGMYISSSGTGNWNNWLLGYDNHWFIVFFIAYYVAIMYVKFGGNRIRSILLVLVIHVSAFITLSGVLVVGVILMDILLLSRVYKRKFFDFKFVLIIGIISFIILLFFYYSPVVNLIVYSLLGKTRSLTARLSIWNTTIQYIADNPIIGYGRQATEIRQIMYHNPHGVNAHNMWFELLYEGGIVSFGCFIGIICIVGKKISLYRKSESAGIWLVTFLACFITLNVDSAFELRGAMFFWLLSIGYHFECLDKYDI